MKKTLLIASLAVAGLLSVQAQGTINAFANGSGTLVTTNNGTTSGSAAITSTKVELFYAPSTTSLSLLTSDSGSFLGLGSAWETMTLTSTAGAEAVTSISPIAGRFSQSAAIFTGLDVAGGANVYLQVRGWTGGYANWAAAVAAWQINPSSVLLGWTTYQGGSVVNPWLNVTGDPNAVPATTGAFGTGAGKFNGLVLTQVGAVPEPSTLVLAGLGGLSLLAFRRKK